MKAMKKHVFRRSLAAVALLGLTAALYPAVGSAQATGVISATFSLASTGFSPVLNLNGQSLCSIVTVNGATFTIIPQASSDSGQTWTTVTSIGSGSITALGPVTGNVATVGLTNFRFSLTALTGGPLQGTMTCSPANSATVTGAFPTPIPFPSPLGVVVTNATPIPVLANTPAPCTAAACEIETVPFGLDVIAPLVLTAASAQSCTAIATVPAALKSITNANSADQTVTLSLFNDNASCAAGVRLVQVILAAGQTINYSELYFSTAMSYTLSGAATANIVVNYVQ